MSTRSSTYEGGMPNNGTREEFDRWAGRLSNLCFLVVAFLQLLRGKPWRD